MDDKKKGSSGSAGSTKNKKKKKWSFPTVSKCPRCGSTDTIAASTQDNVQYRTCRVAICRKRFTVMGTKV